MLVAAEKNKNKKNERKGWNSRKPVLMEDIRNIRLQILEESRNMKSSFLIEDKTKRECYDWNLGEVYKPSRRANLVSKGATWKQTQDHKLINKPTLKQQWRNTDTNFQSTR